MEETLSEGIVKEADDNGLKIPALEYNTDPEVVLKDEVGQRVDDYWADTVISHMEFQWFRIRKEENRIIIEPVKVEPIA